MNNNQSVHVCMLRKSCIGSKISECVSCGLSGFGPFFTEPHVMRGLGVKYPRFRFRCSTNLKSSVQVRI